MKPKLSRFDAADYLDTDEQICAYLDVALQANDPAYFQDALGTVARARGMQAVAAQAGSTRAGLYKALRADGNPEFATVLRVLQALGLRLTVAAAKPTRARTRKRVA